MAETAPTPQPGAQASAKPAAPAGPLVSATKVVRGVNLTAVHFDAFSAQGYETVDTIPDDAALNAATNFLRPTISQAGEGFGTQTTLVFRLSGSIPDKPETTYAVVRASIRAEYALKPDVQFTPEELSDFALCYCPFHAWGYWREFVQSALARLDLPHVTLPLFLIDQALKMVRDDLESGSPAKN